MPHNPDRQPSRQRAPLSAEAAEDFLASEMARDLSTGSSTEPQEIPATLSTNTRNNPLDGIKAAAVAFGDLFARDWQASKLQIRSDAQLIADRFAQDWDASKQQIAHDFGAVGRFIYNSPLNPSSPYRHHTHEKAMLYSNTRESRIGSDIRVSVPFKLDGKPIPAIDKHTKPFEMANPNHGLVLVSWDERPTAAGVQKALVISLGGEAQDRLNPSQIRAMNDRYKYSKTTSLSLGDSIILDLDEPNLDTSVPSESPFLIPLRYQTTEEIITAAIRRPEFATDSRVRLFRNDLMRTFYLIAQQDRNFRHYYEVLQYKAKFTDIFREHPDHILQYISELLPSKKQYEVFRTAVQKRAEEDEEFIDRLNMDDDLNVLELNAEQYHNAVIGRLEEVGEDHPTTYMGIMKALGELGPIVVGPADTTTNSNPTRTLLLEQGRKPLTTLISLEKLLNDPRTIDNVIEDIQNTMDINDQGFSRRRELDRKRKNYQMGAVLLFDEASTGYAQKTYDEVAKKASIYPALGAAAARDAMNERWGGVPQQEGWIRKSEAKLIAAPAEKKPEPHSSTHQGKPPSQSHEQVVVEASPADRGHDVEERQPQRSSEERFVIPQEDIKHLKEQLENLPDHIDPRKALESTYPEEILEALKQQDPYFARILGDADPQPHSTQESVAEDLGRSVRESARSGGSSATFEVVNDMAGVDAPPRRPYAPPPVPPRQGPPPQPPQRPTPPHNAENAGPPPRRPSGGADDDFELM